MASTLQYSCLENPISDGEAWQGTVYRVAKSRTGLKQPCEHKHKPFFSPCGNSAPVRVDCEGDAAAWLAGTLAVPSVQGTQTASTAGVMALSESFFEPLVAGDQKVSLASLSP